MEMFSRSRLFIYTITDSEFGMRGTCYIDNSIMHHGW